MTCLVSGVTDTGTVRTSNQDAIDWRVDEASGHALLVVADGMGGYQGGEEASRIAVETVMEVLGTHLGTDLGNSPVSESAQSLVQSALNLASERIDVRKAEAPELAKMGTTIVMAWVTGERALIAHIGDSRCYHLHRDNLQCLTRDDTVVQNMLEDGSIREQDVPNVPFRNVLTRALGASDVSATFSEVCLAPGDQLLLCSDGLMEALEEEEWRKLMAEPDSARSGPQALIDRSLERGAKDNVSVVLLTTA